MKRFIPVLFLSLIGVAWRGHYASDGSWCIGRQQNRNADFYRVWHRDFGEL